MKCGAYLGAEALRVTSYRVGDVLDRRCGSWSVVWVGVVEEPLEVGVDEGCPAVVGTGVSVQEPQQDGGAVDQEPREVPEPVDALDDFKRGSVGEGLDPEVGDVLLRVVCCVVSGGHPVALEVLGLHAVVVALG